MLLIKKIHKLMKNVKLYRSLGIIIVFILISSLIFYFFEININPRINTIQDAIWWGFVTSTSVGYGDIYPVTIIGRIISIFLMLIGIGVFGFITGSFASIFLEENIRKGMGLMDVIFKNHIIIIGWNHKTKIIIEELINEDKNLKVVIIDNIDYNPYNNKNISYIKGNPWYDEVLLRANIKYAKRIIVLADRNLKNKDMMDAKSVLICLAINKLNKNIYLISEVANHSNKKLFLRANVNDILISNEIESKILVRSILYKGINKAMKELITNSYGCELYEASISEEYINNKYIDVSFKLLKKGITLIGYFRNGETYLNPKTNIKLQSNDILIYIAPNKIL
ncbi:NAD-binding protein [Clostridium sp. D2Q-14]|uniref:potassium channel family protein n=1 Tax=Anaeromonas gelatinilytica TaxID=2683194 RepID=UPI00193C383B|nr:potassium channel family protein [Anaeromonas gelatinilytica]MBS4536263.1 NAD-binding protein [Anaeromonas gelatinilytica]